MQNRLKHRPALPWLLGALMTAALWGFLVLYSDIHYATNDDQFILRTFMGCQPGGAPNFHLYIHGMYAYPLSWLSGLTPGVAWFSILQIALLSLSLTTIAKSLLQCAWRSDHGPWSSLLFALCFLILFGMTYCARVTYTCTAAMLGAAATAQIMSVDCRNGSDAAILRGMLFALLLVVLCYGLRQMTALPVLCYCGIAFLFKYFTCFGSLKRPHRPLKPLLITLTLVAVVMGGLAIGREIEIDAKGQREYLDWQQARISVLDYIDLEKLPPEALASVGWSDTLNELLLKWYTMDESISTQAFRTLRANYYNQQTRTSPGAAVQDLIFRSPMVVRSMLILTLITSVLIVLLLLRKDCRWHVAALVCTSGFCVLFFAYLALQGRLPYRAVMVPLLPAAAFVFCLLPVGVRPCRRVLLPAFCAFLCVLTLCYALPAAQEIKRRPPSPWDYNAFEDMDQQALAKPDVLYLYSTELVNDMRMFPDMSAGLPQNLMFWGGWQRGSPEYIARTAPFGIDSDHFTPEDWINPSIRYITLKLEPDETLFQYLRETVSPNIILDGQQVSDGLFTFWFTLPEDAA